tara:strand:- start:175 stop:441 length:267 start_codon:yes stop_codon:yes gene_type:complete
MPNTKSAIRRIRRVKAQTKVNIVRKSKYRSAIKQILKLIEKKNKKDALKLLPKINSELMRTAKLGVMKKRKASRLVSRITKKINKIKL